MGTVQTGFTWKVTGNTLVGYTYPGDEYYDVIQL